jgi:hypothetical protein
VLIQVEPEGFKSIVKDRKCRDVGCCAFFIIFWFGMIAVGIVGLTLGYGGEGSAGEGNGGVGSGGEGRGDE